MDNLETYLAATVYKARGNESGDIVERFFKTIASTIFVHPEYLMDGPGPLIAVSVPHYEFYNSSFGIWIGQNNFSDGLCRPIRMHEVWRSLVLRKNKMEQL